MKIQTFSVVVGTSACNAGCKFCISHTTGFEDLPATKSINTAKFHSAVQLARIGGCTTLLFTGKGEPTLYPNELNEYLHLMDTFRERNGFFFPFVEVQTNALDFGAIAQQISDEDLYEKYGCPTFFYSRLCANVFNSLPKKLSTLLHYLNEWRSRGLTTIAISTVGINPVDNKNTYLHHRDVPYPALARTVKFLHQMGFSTRICVMMQKNMVDSMTKLNEVANWCKVNEVAQMTVRPIRKPLFPVLNSDDFTSYIENNGLDNKTVDEIQQGMAKSGTHLMTLMHGNHQAKVYDYFGQNVCMSDCLTVSPESDNIRTLIFYSDGRLVYDWQFPGARLL